MKLKFFLENIKNYNSLQEVYSFLDQEIEKNIKNSNYPKTEKFYGFLLLNKDGVIESLQGAESFKEVKGFNKKANKALRDAQPSTKYKIHLRFIKVVEGNELFYHQYHPAGDIEIANTSIYFFKPGSDLIPVAHLRLDK